MLTMLVNYYPMSSVREKGTVVVALILRKPELDDQNF